MDYNIINANKSNIDILIKFKLDTTIKEDLSDKEIIKITNYVKRNINKNYKSYKLILNKNNIIGAYLILPYNNDSIIDEIYIIEEYRNKGIGTKIIKEITSNSKSNIYLWVYKSNKKAIKLYISIGFRINKEEELRYQMIYKI